MLTNLGYLAWLIIGISQVHASDFDLIAVDLERKNQFEVSGNVQVGLLSVGTTSQIRLRLTNTTKASLSLAKASTTCGCVSVVSSQAALAPGEECTLLVDLKPSLLHPGKDWSQTISFDDQDSSNKVTAVTIRLDADLSGVFSLESQQLVFVASEMQDAPDITISEECLVTTSPPVMIDHLSVKGPKILENFEVAITPTAPGIAKVRFSIPNNLVPREGFNTQFRLVDSETKQERKLIVSAIRRAPIRIAPSTLILQKRKGEEKFSAFGVVMHHGGTAKTDLTSSDEPSISARIGSRSLAVKLRHGSRHFFRFQINMSSEIASTIFSETDSIRCVFDVVWGADRSSQTVLLSKPSL